MVIAFNLGGFYILADQDKPFNPILGETFQGHFKDGTSLYCEHTSHHPPITNFHMQTPDSSFEFWGYYEFVGTMGANSLKSGLRGPNHIRFSDGQHIRFKMPDFKLSGTVMGERIIEASGNAFYEDITNNYKAVVVFSTYKKSGFFKKTETGKRDEYRGLLYECTPITNPDETAKLMFSHHPMEIHDLKKIEDIVKPICEIEGSWLYYLKIGEKTYWEIEKHLPERYTLDTEYVCPSDWRYREDLIWLKYKFVKIAQKWKIRMEEQQRKDRKLRQKCKEEREKYD